MAKLSGTTLTVTGVALADIPTALALQVPPDHIAISDTAATIQADLISGTPAILPLLSQISAITVSDAGTIQLTATQILAAGVDDGPTSALAKMSGGTLAVTNVDLASLNTIATLAAAPNAIAVSDTAANIQADLVSGSSQLVAHDAVLTDVNASDAGTVTLTDAQITAPGVDDGATSALAHFSGGTLVVTNAATADLATLAGLTTAPTQVQINDTAANVQADLVAATSQLLTHAGIVGGVTLSELGHDQPDRGPRVARRRR